MIDLADLKHVTTKYHSGYILCSEGLMLVASLPQAFVGELCTIKRADESLPDIYAEVVSISEVQVKLMPFQSVSGISFGDKLIGSGASISLPMGSSMLGHVVDAFGEPLDDQKLSKVPRQTAALAAHINPLSRAAIVDTLHTKVKALDSFIPIGKGQRIGILAGSGVGKSTLLAMLSESCAQQNAVIVIVLVGERGREVEEFVSRDMFNAMRNRAVLIAATAEEMPVTRVLSVKYGLSLAESLSREGKEVIFVVDSLTRVAMAQREIGLAIGEPPTAKGYTPSVFSLLQRIVERCGAFRQRASITALFSILVETDDFDDPIVDTLRAVLDGHIVLDRALAEQGHFPAIDILRSVSRLTANLFDMTKKQLARDARGLLSEYKQKKMMIELAEAEDSLTGKLQDLRDRHQKLIKWLQQDELNQQSIQELDMQLLDILDGK
ncbi:FliI/YscN family ATPase [Shewanella woodyi]|uniref:FliI/YscN family ATPase n=1 Tax=Shewanella woodyi TaxID=60961 RepID=UPI003749C8F1